MSNITLFALIVAAVLGLSQIAAPSEAHKPQHIVPFQVISVYDGDTITGTAMLWPNLLTRTAVRLRGIDTPEIRGGCTESKALALKARALTDSLVKTAYEVSLSRPTIGKFAGRVVADVLIDGSNIAPLLIERGLAKPYDGKSRRPSWCPQEKKEEL